MTSEAALETGRPRPQSGGFRTFLSWLKREERLGASSESVSSCGSDHTVTSFAFLPPTHYKNIEPIILKPAPPTDSYRKRIRDRNLRLHLDKDLTLCRKYHLTADPANYDGFSLPNERRHHEPDRGRRATSVYLQRRAPYVPGKRHAPAPPLRASSLGPVPYNRKSRKRQAPQPPNIRIQIKLSKEPTKTEVDSSKKSHLTQQDKCKQSKEKMDENVGKSHKQSEKSFLRQIFEGKKRISVCDPVAVRLLPSISELDRQAAEIIQNKIRNEKLKKHHDNFDRPSTSSNITETKKYTENDLDVNKDKEYNQVDEKQELKKILKEMKDSLPKRPKPAKDKDIKPSTSYEFQGPVEATTLRVGLDPKEDHTWQWSPIKKVSTSENNPATNNNVTSQNIKVEIEVHSRSFKPIEIDDSKQKLVKLEQNVLLTATPPDVKQTKTPLEKTKDPAQTTVNNTSKSSEQSDTNNTKNKLENNNTKQVKNLEIPQKTNKIEELKVLKVPPSLNKAIITDKPIVILNEPDKLPNANTTPKSPTEDQETQRRQLIFDLEKYIVAGDERGAAKAAMQLAQLRLTGTVLSESLLKSNSIATTSINKQPIENNANICDIVKETPNNNVKNSNNNPIPDVVPSTSAKNKVATTANSDVKPTTSSGTSTSEVIRNILDINKDQIRDSSSKSKAAIKAIASSSKPNNNNLVPVEVWVEDREAARGPVRLHVLRGTNLGHLRRQAEITLGLPSRLQRWIVGRNLCTDDDISLETMAGPDLRTPFYVCLVDSGLNKDASKTEPEEAAEINKNQLTDQNYEKNVYDELMQLERRAVVPNTEKFECGICMVEYNAGEGVVLRECVHTFCKECLAASIQHCVEPQVACPWVGCAGVLQEREVRALVVPGEYERWLARGLAAAESGARHSFHCRTRDCTGWALCEPGVRRFPCPVCKKTNCVPCQVIHEGLTCEQHRSKQAQETAKASIDSKVDQGTKALLDGLIERGEALSCPECNAIITKKWGCDWVRCSACKTEICWITRGRRWGPGGRGDTTAGCRCGVDGKRCHPSCAYCH